MISVIVPVYNRTEELKRAIKSVINQTVKDWELLVVDDCSDKDIKSVVDSFGDKRIHYYQLEKKGNANVCRNLGIKKTKGEYIAMLDSDDEWLPEHLQICLNTLEQLRSDGIFSSYKVFDGENYSSNIIRPLRKGECMTDYIIDGNSAATPTHFYKTSCAREILWDEELQRHQDYDFAIRFAEKFSFLPIQLFTVIVHWTKGEKRIEHLTSQIKFLEKHKNRMSKKMFVKYNREVYAGLTGRKDVEESALAYFKTNVLNNIKEMSITDYMSVFGNNLSAFRRMMIRLSYVSKVLMS
jgi:glycosyltransferase involved in cell wall biosynthesis